MFFVKNEHFVIFFNNRSCVVSVLIGINKRLIQRLNNHSFSGTIRVCVLFRKFENKG